MDKIKHISMLNITLILKQNKSDVNVKRSKVSQNTFTYRTEG